MDALYAVNSVIHLIFITDLILNFFLPFKERGHYVKSHRRIATRYLRSWFTLDVISIVPIDSILMTLKTDSSNLSMLSMIRRIPKTATFRLLTHSVSYSIPSYSVSSHPVSHPIPSHASHPVPSHLHPTSSRPTSPRPVLPHPISSHPILSHLKFHAIPTLPLTHKIRMLRLLRLLKLVRILRASRIFNRWENMISITYSAREMIGWILFITLLLHWLACAIIMQAQMFNTLRGPIASELQRAVEVRDPSGRPTSALASPARTHTQTLHAGSYTACLLVLLSSTMNRTLNSSATAVFKAIPSLANIASRFASLPVRSTC